MDAALRRRPEGRSAEFPTFPATVRETVLGPEPVKISQRDMDEYLTKLGRIVVDAPPLLRFCGVETARNNRLQPACVIRHPSPGRRRPQSEAIFSGQPNDTSSSRKEQEASSPVKEKIMRFQEQVSVSESAPLRRI